MNLLMTMNKTLENLEKGGRRKAAPAGQGAFSFDEEEHPRAPTGGQGKYHGGEFVPKGQETHPAVTTLEHPGHGPALLVPVEPEPEVPQEILRHIYKDAMFIAGRYRDNWIDAANFDRADEAGKFAYMESTVFPLWVSMGQPMPDTPGYLLFNDRMFGRPEKKAGPLYPDPALLVLAKGRGKAPAGQGTFNFDEEAHPRAAAGTAGKYRAGEFVPRSAAYRMGQAAFHRGLSAVPMMDTELMGMLEETQAESAPHMTEWTKGWHHANMADQEQQGQEEAASQPDEKTDPRVSSSMGGIPGEPGEERDNEVRTRIGWLKQNMLRNDVRLRRGNITPEVHAEERAGQEERLKFLENLLPPEPPKLVLDPNGKEHIDPWFLTATGYNSRMGVHTPWIAEISPMQYGMFSRRQREAYDKKREAEWAASIASKEEWAAKVMAAVDAGTITRQTPGLSRDAEETIFHTLRAREAAAAKVVQEQKSRDNQIRSVDEVNVGDRVFDIMSGRYAQVLKKFKVGVRIQVDNPEGGYHIGPHTVNVGGLQRLKYDDLHKGKRSVPAGQGAFTFDEEEHPRAPAGTTGQYRGGEFVPRVEVTHPAVTVEEHPGHGPALVLTVSPQTGNLKLEGKKMRTQREDTHRPAEMVPSDYEYLGMSYPVEGSDTQGNPTTEIEWDGNEEWEKLGQPRRSTLPHAKPGQCDHCGASHKYRAILRHTPTGGIASVGHQCYENRFDRPDWQNQVASVARRAELRAQREANVTKALAQMTEDERGAYTWALGEGHTSSLARDIAQKVEAHGPLSDKQKALLVKLQREEAAKMAELERKALTLTPVPEGPQKVTGTILGFKEAETQYGTTMKMIIEDDRGFKVYGTRPALIGQGGIDKGARVEFEAELQRSKDDQFFGFFSRPKKVKLADVTDTEQKVAQELVGFANEFYLYLTLPEALKRLKESDGDSDLAEFLIIAQQGSEKAAIERYPRLIDKYPALYVMSPEERAARDAREAAALDATPAPLKKRQRMNGSEPKLTIRG